MGGALIILALVAATLLWCDLRSPLVWLTLLVTVGFGAVGFVDDYLKISMRNKRGLPGRFKLGVEVLIGGFAISWLFAGDALVPELRLHLAPPLVNFHHHSLVLPLAVYVAFGIFVVVGTSQSVNLTDGLDGLAIGPVIICSFTFLLLAYAAGTTLRSFNIADYLGMPHVAGAGELAVFCGAMGGAGIGVLWFNTHPAQVIGGVFVAEAVSAIIQVMHFKRTGRRVFLMAPIHHHFEKKGWPESRIVVRFWIVSFACAILGLLLTLKVR